MTIGSIVALATVCLVSLHIMRLHIKGQSDFVIILDLFLGPMSILSIRYHRAHRYSIYTYRPTPVGVYDLTLYDKGPCALLQPPGRTRTPPPPGITPVSTWKQCCQWSLHCQPSCVDPPRSQNSLDLESFHLSIPVDLRRDMSILTWSTLLDLRYKGITCSQCNLLWSH